MQSYNTTSLLPVKVFSLIERIFLASIAEDYVRENHFVYKFWGETSVYRDYFFKDPGGGKGFDNQSRPGLDTSFSKSAVPQLFFKDGLAQSDRIVWGLVLIPYLYTPVDPWKCSVEVGFNAAG